MNQPESDLLEAGRDGNSSLEGGSKSRFVYYANLSWLSVDKIGKLLITAVVGIVLARTLGPQPFGTLNLGVAIQSLLFAIYSLGLEAVLLRYLILYPGHRNQILGSAFDLRLKAAIGMFLFFVLWLLVATSKFNQLHIIILFLLFGSVFQSYEIIETNFQSQNNFKLVAKARTSILIITAVFKLIAAIVLHNLLLVAFLFGLDNLLSGLVLLLIYRRHQGKIRNWKTHRHLKWFLFSKSWPLMIANLSIILYMRIDQIMLGVMLGRAEVGYYSAAGRISQVFYYIPVVLTTAFTPLVTKIQSQDPPAYLNRFHRLFWRLTVISYLASISMMFMSSTVVRLLFGVQYQPASGILSIHIWTCVFVFLGVAQGPWYVNEGMTQRAMVRSLLGAAINIAVNLVLIPRYGAYGAALATLISQAFASYLFNCFHPSTRSIFYLQTKSLMMIPPPSGSSVHA